MEFHFFGNDNNKICNLSPVNKNMKTLIVYMHLLGACVAIGVLLIQDVAIMRSKGAPLNADAAKELIRSARIVSVALLCLWCSGILLFAIGYVENPQQYITNQKLWSKFVVVSILTINGFFLHFYSFPKVISVKGLLGFGLMEQVLVTLSGAVSSVSWLFACYLGVARPWNNTTEFSYIMSVYLALLIPAIFLSFEFLRFIRRGSAPMLEGRIQFEPIRSTARKMK
jgi:hypothetical protein